MVEAGHEKGIKSGSSESEPTNNFTSVYISNLPHELSDEDISSKFDKFGRIAELDCIRDPITQKSR